MLYILGGASRSGKSIISRRFVKVLGIPFFSLDFLVTSLQDIPSLHIKHNQPFIEKSENIWPMAKNMLSHIISEEPNYLIEGDGILPGQVTELSQLHPNSIQSAFVGYTEMSAEVKLKEIRKFGGQKDDWTLNYSNDEMENYITDMIEFSKYLKTECEKNNIPFFDVSSDFSNKIDEVFNYFKQTTVVVK
jgi:2-phosphoglycerate kinase